MPSHTPKKPFLQVKNSGSSDLHQRSSAGMAPQYIQSKEALAARRTPAAGTAQTWQTLDEQGKFP